MKHAIEAITTVHQRMSVYGPPARNHALTAKLVGAWLDAVRENLGDEAANSPEAMCVVNILQKVGRLANGTHEDSYVDIIGYILNIDMLDDNQRMPLADGTAYEMRPGAEREHQAARKRVRLVTDDGEVLATVFVPRENPAPSQKQPLGVTADGEVVGDPPAATLRGMADQPIDWAAFGNKAEAKVLQKLDADANQCLDQYIDGDPQNGRKDDLVFYNLQTRSIVEPGSAAPEVKDSVVSGAGPWTGTTREEAVNHARSCEPR